MKAVKTISAIALLFCSMLTCAAGDGHFALGTFHSFKGFGICSDFGIRDRSFNTATVYADIYGLVDRTVSTPGIMMNVTHETIFWQFDCPQGEVLSIYGGPGVCLGYVRDHEFSFGLLTALSCNVGIKADFPRGISISLEFEGDIGLHMHNVDRFDKIQSRIYENGYRRAYVPQVRISYTF